jgi:hypothetical protein
MSKEKKQAWKIYHLYKGVKFVDCYYGDTAQEAKENFKKTVEWSKYTKILTIKKWII